MAEHYIYCFPYLLNGGRDISGPAGLIYCLFMLKKALLGSRLFIAKI